MHIFESCYNVTSKYDKYSFTKIFTGCFTEYINILHITQQGITIYNFRKILRLNKVKIAFQIVILKFKDV